MVKKNCFYLLTKVNKFQKNTPELVGKIFKCINPDRGIFRRVNPFTTVENEEITFLFPDGSLSEVEPTIRDL